ncbi:MAG TPA: carboxylesterase family protein [Pirellulales bacterium]
MATWLFDRAIDRRCLLKVSLFGAAGATVGESLIPRLIFGAEESGKAAGADKSSAESPIAITTAGKIRGFVDQQINVFKGVPYGGDTSQRRFQPSLAPSPWTETRDCLAFGPAAPVGGGGGQRKDNGVAIADNREDCLRLNVWTPALRDGGKRPVMVYIHGGAYSSGTGNSNLYDGVHLCHRGNVVVVTMNHRLNVFGFLYLKELGGPEFADSGNVGMLDLVLMLKWVRDNIAEFGGDPGNVLIFGQSGGGAKCATLMAMPEAHGLFHRVISMSGQQVTATQPEHATETAKQVLAALDITPERIAEIKKIPVDRLLSAMRGHYFGPVKDGRSLPRDPFDPDAPPLSASIPMMLGNTHDETVALIGGSDASLFTLTWETLPGKIDQHIKQFLGDLKPSDVAERYRKMYPSYSPSQVFFAATTAFRSWRSQVIESERRAEQNSPGGTFVYQLNWGTERNGGRWAGHASDIPLALDNVNNGSFFSPQDRSAANPEGQKMADIMADTFIAFVRTGVPDNPRIPHWPSFNLKERPTMIFDLEPKIEDDPRGDERRLIETVSYTQPGT